MSATGEEELQFPSTPLERWVRDRAQMILDGEERGRAEGLEQGIEKGIEQGLERVATEMFADGWADETIQRVTGLSPAELAELKAKPRP